MRNGLQPLEPGSGWSDFREIWAGGKAKPDCILFGDDMLFQDACPAIQTCGARIPDELEIVVLSNKGMPLPQYVPFTRLDCDLAEVAGEMGTMLLQLTTGQTPANRSVDVPYRPAEREDEEQQTVAAHQGQEERESRSLL
jgi:DNA-binding LacI/PurR family transcriptional regulator